MSKQPQTQIQEPPPLHLSVRIKQAAKALGISERKVYDLLSRGEIRATKIAGRIVVIRVSELEAFLDRCDENE
jgi:excisionase family DNA binding protein